MSTHDPGRGSTPPDEAPAPAGPAPWRRWLPRVALGAGGAVALGFVVLVLLALS